MKKDVANRKSRFAGPYSFYPNEPRRLQMDIQNYFNNAKVVDHLKPPAALLSPHAGYVYSGQTAAWGYKQLFNYEYQRAIVIAPSHRGKFTGVSMFPGNAYETPFGEIPLDNEFCKEISKNKKLVTYDQHAEENEHSLEVQLPFLQIAIHNFKLVPLLISDQKYENCRQIADLLIKTQKAKPATTIVVASSDLYHGPGIEACNQADENFMEKFLRFAPEEFNKCNSNMELTACGYGPLTVAMMFAKAFGSTEIKALYHTNSSEAAGASEEYVVGYLAASIS